VTGVDAPQRGVDVVTGARSDTDERRNSLQVPAVRSRRRRRVDVLKPVQTYQRTAHLTCADPRPSALNMTLPAFAAERGRLQEISIDSWYAAPVPAAIDRLAWCSAAKPPHAAAAVERRDRLTDRRSDRRPTVT